MVSRRQEEAFLSEGNEVCRVKVVQKLCETLGCENGIVLGDGLVEVGVQELSPRFKLVVTERHHHPLASFVAGFHHSVWGGTKASELCSERRSEIIVAEAGVVGTQEAVCGR